PHRGSYPQRVVPRLARAHLRRSCANGGPRGVWGGTPRELDGGFGRVRRRPGERGAEYWPQWRSDGVTPDHAAASRPVRRDRGEGTGQTEAARRRFRGPCTGPDGAADGA